jgi:hypothetical protein
LGTSSCLYIPSIYYRQAFLDNPLPNVHFDHPGVLPDEFLENLLCVWTIYVNGAPWEHESGIGQLTITLDTGNVEGTPGETVGL